MTTFTINDEIFKPLKEADGADPAALQNFVNALNQNAYANATFTQAVQRGDFVFELVDHADLAKVGAGALFSNDRGTPEFIARDNQFAIKLDKDWFVPNGSNAAGLTHPQIVASDLGIVTHEADHSNTQALFDEAYKINSTTPDTYRPDLIGVARVVAAVDLTMKAEVAGWYADLKTLRIELDDGRISQVKFDALTDPANGSVAGKLLAVEAEGKALGLSGDALTDYVSDHGKGLLPSGYIERYTASYAPGTDPQEVRAHLAYALNDPNGIYSFTEEVGPDGTYVATATYNNGDTRTTVDSGVMVSAETVFGNGSREVFQYDVDNSESWSTSYSHYDAQGRNDATEVTMDDGSRSQYEYYDPNGFMPWSAFERHYDAEGRNDWYGMTMNDGSRNTVLMDVSNSESWSSIQSHFDTQGRNDSTYFFMDDGNIDQYQYDVSNSESWSSIYTKFDASGRKIWAMITGHDGSNTVQNYDKGVEDWREISYADGSRDWIDFDQNYERKDKSLTVHYDASGREDWNEIIYHDGSRDWIDFDQNNEREDSVLQVHYDALGREDWRSITLNDGSRDLYDFDQAGWHSWSSIYTKFDASGREDYSVMYQYDGGRQVTDYDQDNSQDWIQVVTNFDAQGREDWIKTTYNNGESILIDYDQDGSKDWIQMETHYDVDGSQTNFAIQYNSGEWSTYY